MHARHTTPSRFVHGDLDATRTVLEGTLATKIKFAVYGVQPGIRLPLIDAHLADLMAFGVNYVRQGGAAKAAWLVSP
jgi:hypothetical protein